MRLTIPMALVMMLAAGAQEDLPKTAEEEVARMVRAPRELLAALDKACERLEADPASEVWKSILEPAATQARGIDWKDRTDEIRVVMARLLRLSGAALVNELAATSPDLNVARNLARIGRFAMHRIPESLIGTKEYVELLRNAVSNAENEWLKSKNPFSDEASRDIVPLEWKADSWLEVTRDDEGLTIEHRDRPSDPDVGICTLARAPTWLEFCSRMEFIARGGPFGLVLRYREGTLPAADIQVDGDIGFDWSYGERTTFDTIVRESSWRLGYADRLSRAHPLAGGAAAGGIALRIPRGTTLTLRSLRVLVFHEDW